MNRASGLLVVGHFMKQQKCGTKKMDEDTRATYVLANILWKRWMEMLPNSPAWMATKIVEDLAKVNFHIDFKDKPKFTDPNLVCKNCNYPSYDCDCK